MTKTAGTCPSCNPCGSAGSSGAIYGLGVVGAAVFFIQQAHTFWEGVIGVLKAIVWPALIVYQSLKFLNG